MCGLHRYEYIQNTTTRRNVCGSSLNSHPAQRSKALAGDTESAIVDSRVAVINKFRYSNELTNIHAIVQPHINNIKIKVIIYFLLHIVSNRYLVYLENRVKSGKHTATQRRRENSFL